MKQKNISKANIVKQDDTKVETPEWNHSQSMYTRINKFRLTNKKNIEFKIGSGVSSKRMKLVKAYVYLIIKA